ncbi:MAG: DUF6495 family protein [Flavobacteriaceae bacterium]
MKYARLTEEQFTEFEEEFINFLSTQSITAEEWCTMKEENPNLAEDELDVFSDLIWEGVLSNVNYLESISPQSMHLFSCDEKEMHLISVKILNPDVDLGTEVGFAWFRKNWQSDFVEYLTAAKAYSTDKNIDKFELIQKGAVITKGALFQWFDDVIEE